MKKILLVNPVPSNYPPMGLMKYSTFYKSIGYKIKYIEKINMFDDFNPHLIIISTLFTWDYYEIIRTTLFLRKQNPSAEIYVGGISASLLQKDFEQDFKGKNIKVRFGIQKSIDNCELDYSLSKKDYSIAYTTRGCPRKCPWCMVWRIEPEYKELNIKDWSKMIKHKRVLFYDNNILKSSLKHFKEVIDYCKFHDISFDFNQAMDARLLSIQHLEILKESKISPIRFAFDSMETDGSIQRAIKLSIKYGLTDGSVYVLYNFNEKPEEFYYRIKEIVKTWYFDTYPMKFQPLKSKKKDQFIGKHWNEQRLYNFKITLNNFFNNSLIGRSMKIKKFEKIFGKDEKEFVSILDHKNIIARNEHIKENKKPEIKNTKDSLFQYDEDEIQKIINDSEGLLTRKDAIEILNK